MDTVKKKIKPNNPNQESKQGEQVDKKEVKQPEKEIVETTEEEEARMLKQLFGIDSFGSSKGKDHTESAVEAVSKGNLVKRKYRQYMNRKGGFNKPLDKMA